MDRRTFLTNSALILASSAVAPKALASAMTKKGRDAEESWYAWCQGWTPGMRFIQDLVSMWNFDISKIAYCPTSPKQAEFATQTLFPRARKPFFATLDSLIMKELPAHLHFYPISMTPKDRTWFLRFMPDPCRAEKKILAHTHERMQATSTEDVFRWSRLVDPTLPFFEGPNRDEVDCYAVYRLKTGLLDQADVLSLGLMTLKPWDGIDVAVIEGPDIQPLYLAAANKLLAEDRGLFVYRI